MGEREVGEAEDSNDLASGLELARARVVLGCALCISTRH